ncbi:MAG: hypothetical protein Q9190_003286 [Brigantiaea leucoxantha]
MLASLDFPFQIPVGDLSTMVKGASEKNKSNGLPMVPRPARSSAAGGDPSLPHSMVEPSESAGVESLEAEAGRWG